MPDDRSLSSDLHETVSFVTPAEQVNASDESKTQARAESDTGTGPREYGGRKGPDPVRYGDWEKNGRCIDF